MRKFTAFVLILILLCSLTPVASGSQQIAANLTSSAEGTVVQIFDATSFAVRLFDGKIAYVKLLGLKPAVKEGGLKYLHDAALGQTVTISPDFSGGTSAKMDGRFNLMYAYLKNGAGSNDSADENLNVTLLDLGFAEVDTRFSSIAQYQNLLKAQREALSQKVGVWDDGVKAVYSGGKINVNTASRSDFDSLLPDNAPSSLASNIISYRSYTTFGDINELKFVNGMTREVFNNIRGFLTVITNINTASEKELLTLNYNERFEIDAILSYRTSHTFSNLSQLHTKSVVSESFHDKNEPFMSVDDTTKMVYAKPDKVVNANTASLSQLSNISDVGGSLASRIVANRQKGYTLKTLMEIKELNNLTDAQIHRLADNLTLYTDINSATDRELESLFANNHVYSEIREITVNRRYSSIERLALVLRSSRYAIIAPFIYATTFETPERVNLNTANQNQLLDIGMSMSEAKSVLGMSGKMRTASQIPVDVSPYNEQVALYTNINTASVKELRSLNAFTESSINLIIASREEQPFGSDTELEDFFRENKIYNTYSNVSSFIVIR